MPAPASVQRQLNTPQQQASSQAQPTVTINPSGQQEEQQEEVPAGEEATASKISAPFTSGSAIATTSSVREFSQHPIIPAITQTGNATNDAPIQRLITLEAFKTATELDTDFGVVSLGSPRNCVRIV